MVGLVFFKVYSGYYILNLYNFEYFNCNFVVFYVDGKFVFLVLLEFNFIIGNYVIVFLLMVGGKIKDNFIFNLSWNDYLKGYCMYMFDINFFYEEENNLLLLRKGYFCFQFKFDSFFFEFVICICYGKFLVILSIDVSCNVEVK